MSLRLSKGDQLRLQHATQVLLSPTAYGDLDGWRRETGRALRPLLGADKAMFLLPMEGIQPLYSEEVDTQLLLRYPAEIHEISTRHRIDEKKRQLRICSRDQIWGPHLPEYYRSEYYNELVAPNRAFDAIEMTVPLGPEVKNVATIWCHHESLRGRRFGERGLALLRMLYPAFQSGAESVSRLRVQRDVLARTVDQLTDGLLVCDRLGRVVHQSAALQRTLSADAEGAGVLRAMRRLAEEVAQRVGPPNGVAGVEHAPALAREVATRQARYRIRASLLEREPAAGEAAILIALEQTSAEPLTAEALQARFGLTGAEARVALLLAQGLSNAEIAKRLFLSPHTVRHHVEKIMRKLGVDTRTEAATRLLGT
jgi:DNA-binding CsgD family transcriptional regulator